MKSKFKLIFLLFFIYLKSLFSLDGINEANKTQNGYFFDIGTSGLISNFNMISTRFNTDHYSINENYNAYGGIISIKEILYTGFQYSNIDENKSYSGIFDFVLKHYDKYFPLGINLEIDYIYIQTVFRMGDYKLVQKTYNLGAGLSVYTIFMLTSSIKIIPEIGYAQAYPHYFSSYKEVPDTFFANLALIFRSQNQYFLFTQFGVGKTEPSTISSFSFGFGIPF
jgi:hypothetical protein